MPKYMLAKQSSIPVLTVVYRNIQANKAEKITANLTNPNSAISGISTYDEMTLLENLITVIETADDIYEVREFADSLYEEKTGGQ